MSSRGDYVSTGKALDTLSLDFNPRDLVAKWAPREPVLRWPAHSQLEAIYVPTKGRADRIHRLLNGLQGSNAPIYLLPSCANDIPTDVLARKLPLDQLPFQDSEFFGAVRSLRCFSNPIFSVSLDTWDLPLKRNYALWHARKHRFRRILLLDDDIRGLDCTRLRIGAIALCRWILAGYFVDDFPDTSVLGHVEIAVGEHVSTFLSGSCLFVRTEGTIRFFPPIYNEDWIFMAPMIASGNVCSMGLIGQDVYDPFSEGITPVFQEPGEIIADGLFTLLAGNSYRDRFQARVWNTLLSQRRSWLKALTRRAKDSRHRQAVENALARCHEVSGVDCASYISDLEDDHQRWQLILQELC